MLIKEYKHWKVFLYENQCYLGRMYIWAKRQDALDFFDMTEDEKEEYFSIGRQLKQAMGKLFQPDLYNYTTMANVTPHLHTHFVPRYSSEREFAGMTFLDKRWGKNYNPIDKEFKAPKAVLVEIRDAIRGQL